MRVGIIQSNYIPWRGYFEFIERCDQFIILDDVQYTRRDWRNRNKIRTPRGDVWLTIPLKQTGNYEAKISEMEVSDPIWDRRHFDTLRSAYRTAKHWNKYEDELEWTYIDAPKMLTGINLKFLQLGCKWLGANTPIRLDAEFAAEGAKSDRLISLCKSIGASRYLSGPAARNYLDVAAFNKEGIEVEWMQYSGWPKLSFLHGIFNGLESR